MSVGKIIDSVRRDGDRAVQKWTKKFDRVNIQPNDFRVRGKEFTKAIKKVSPEFLKAIKNIARRIESFHLKEKTLLFRRWLKKEKGIYTGQVISTISSVGIYVPGGRYPYPSTVLMAAIPARIAGVKRIVITTPPKNLTAELLVAAMIAGVKEIYRICGAQAIAALSLGTKTIPRVNFIVGPGNRYVNEAKRQVFGMVGIDSLAGPSEVLIWADKESPADWIASDMMAQSEHDTMAKAILVSEDRDLLLSVKNLIPAKFKKQMKFFYITDERKIVAKINEIAPEHLELVSGKAKKFLPQIQNAGTIFIGPLTPTAIGDYVAGPSHILPTGGAAKFSSGLSVSTFIKRTSLISLNEEGFNKISQYAIKMAEVEGLEYHKKSLLVRMVAGRRVRRRA